MSYIYVYWASFPGQVTKIYNTNNELINRFDYPFEYILILKNGKTEVKTIMAALASLATRYGSEPTFQLAGLLMSTIPCILIYILAQKQIVQGVDLWIEQIKQ